MRRILYITLALVISLAAGLWVRTLQAPDDNCTVAALDGVLSGGELVLADDCVLMLDGERVSDPQALLLARPEPYLVRVGKRRFARVRVV